MTRRVQRVEELIKELLSQYIQVTMTDKIGIVFINDVSVTSDFKEAKVYLSTLEKENETQALTELNRQKFALHRHLKDKMSLKFVPNLSFYPDSSFDKIKKVDELLGVIDYGS